LHNPTEAMPGAASGIAEAIFAAIGKGADALVEFSSDLADYSGSSQHISVISADMPFRSSQAQASICLNAWTIFVNFHAAGMADGAVGEDGRSKPQSLPEKDALPVAIMSAN
jgi:hypothetical protein